MAKRPKHRLPSSTARAWAAIKRNPLKATAAVLALIASLGGIVAQRANLILLWDNIMYASRAYARDNEVIANLRASISSQGIILDFMRLKEERAALKDAQQELAVNPDSRTAPLLIDNLQRSIDAINNRLDKASKHGAE